MTLLQGHGKRNINDVVGVIWHQPGPGPWKKRKLEESYLDALCRTYHSMNTYPHFVICPQEGSWRQLAAIDTIAWHTGSKEREALAHHKYVPPTWWTRECPTLKRPSDWPLWPSPNAVTIGIEVAPTNGDYRKPIDAAAVLRIYTTIRQEHFQDMAVEPYHYTHSVVDPISRSNSKGPWDPHPHWVKAYHGRTAEDIWGT